MVSNSIPRSPQVLLERLFFILCILCILIFWGAFQGSLVTILSHPKYYPDIKTLRELARTNYPIYTTAESLKNDTFGDSNSRLNKKLNKMLTIYNGSKDLTSLVLKKGNCGFLYRKSNAVLTNTTR